MFFIGIIIALVLFYYSLRKTRSRKEYRRERLREIRKAYLESFDLKENDSNPDQQA